MPLDLDQAGERHERNPEKQPIAPACPECEFLNIRVLTVYFYGCFSQTLMISNISSEDFIMHKATGEKCQSV